MLDVGSSFNSFIDALFAFINAILNGTFGWLTALLNGIVIEFPTL